MNKFIASVILGALFFLCVAPFLASLFNGEVCFSAVYARQEAPSDNSNKTSVQEDQSVLYIVMAVIIVLWLGIFTYMVKLDRQVKKIEKEIAKE